MVKRANISQIFSFGDESSKPRQKNYAEKRQSSLKNTFDNGKPYKSP